MAARDDKAESDLTAATRPEEPRFTGTEVIALVLSLGWLAAAGAFFMFVPSEPVEGGSAGFDSLRFVMTLMAVFLPVAMIWVAAAAARSARIVREESRRLQVAIDAMRKTYVADRQARGSAVPSQSSVERKLNEIARSAQKTESALATFATSRTAVARPPANPPSPPTAAADDQPTLALGTPVEDSIPPIDRSVLIRALNFPDTDKDEEGFAALRRALRDRKAKLLIQAAQDILTLLSHDGIYMDDMRPDRARPEVWRRFAKGERGRSVAAMGGIRDRSSLALTAGRMREDTIFRDAAHHFLRKFDQMLVEFETDATDEEIDDLAKTRTARAFMLLGRVTGAFD
ncbi:hypothetical protein EU803_14625 [Loktanella sp. IMCC34160]|uniref:hypothetical protein n=1 Tax=Loktanella sp. IMCC34160 TaxID=2510646 RepID=UPI00101D09F6|nr:hypothetical protein [Loktanella sp. IMCC34160]RYG90453.1 hypothetical protein EU803_14625 [Loktanella sp. IMCC34160]